MGCSEWLRAGELECVHSTIDYHYRHFKSKSTYNCFVDWKTKGTMPLKSTPNAYQTFQKIPAVTPDNHSCLVEVNKRW